MLFALICIEVSVVLEWLLVLVGVQASPGINPHPQNLGIPAVFDSALPIASVILAPIGGAIGVFLSAAIVQLLVRLVVGAGNSGYRTTFKVAAYTQVTSLISWIPIIGPILTLYGVFLFIVGLREVHRTTTGKTVLVFLIPLIAIVVVVLLTVGAVVFSQR